MVGVRAGEDGAAVARAAGAGARLRVLFFLAAPSTLRKEVMSTGRASPLGPASAIGRMWRKTNVAK
jgi:hypothetical protein